MLTNFINKNYTIYNIETNIKTAIDIINFFNGELNNNKLFFILAVVINTKLE